MTTGSYNASSYGLADGRAGRCRSRHDVPIARVDARRAAAQPIAKQTRSQGLNRSTGKWSTTHTGITLFYGPPTGGGIGQPAPAGRYLQISETLTLDDQFQRGVRNYSPPEGKLLVFGNGTIGVMQKHGVHLFLDASSADLLTAAAKSLAPR